MILIIVNQMHDLTPVQCCNKMETLTANQIYAYDYSMPCQFDVNLRCNSVIIKSIVNFTVGFNRNRMIIVVYYKW